MFAVSLVPLACPYALVKAPLGGGFRLYSCSNPSPQNIAAQVGGGGQMLAWLMSTLA